MNASLNSIKRHRIVASDPHDPLAQLLAAALQSREPIRICDLATDFEETDSLWFTSHSEFIAAAGLLYDKSCEVHIMLRQTANANETVSEGTESSILLEIRRLFPKDSLKFYALSNQSKQYFTEFGISEITVLLEDQTPQPSVRANRAKATIDPTNMTVSLTRNGEDRVIGFGAINLARLARDYMFTARDDAAPDWHDLASFATHVGALNNTVGENTYVFITPNGVGIGHLTRQLAIARVLSKRAKGVAPPRIIFWCYSRAAEIARRAGYEVLLRHTVEHLRADKEEWLKWETQAFAQFLRHLKPSAVITDGSRVEPFIVQAMLQAGCHHARLIWIQRGMWQAETDIRGLADIRFCDLVLIPGDLATSEDKGATSRPNQHPPGLSTTVTSPPVILVRPDDYLPRRKARKLLGLGFHKYCLVSLGGDAFSQTSTLHNTIVNTANRTGVRLVWARSPLGSPPPANQTDKQVSLYPVSRYFNAFDGIISAAGYNSFHELMIGCEAPVLFAPTIHARLDDQRARARYAESQGWAQMLDGDQPESEKKTLETFFSDVRKRSNTAREKLSLRDGAESMSDQIANLFQMGTIDGQ